MRLADYFDFLALDDIRIRGHRIGIETILYEYIHRARTPEEIQRSYPTLTLEEIYATRRHPRVPRLERVPEPGVGHVPLGGVRFRQCQEVIRPHQAHGGDPGFHCGSPSYRFAGW